MNPIRIAAPAGALFLSLLTCTAQTAWAVHGEARTRYAMANQCWALYVEASGQYVGDAASGYRADAAEVAAAAPFYLKPTALGKYMLHDAGGRLLANDGGSLSGRSRAEADDSVEWTVKAAGDTTGYPPTPAYHREPTPEQVQAYTGFVDPEIQSLTFTIESTQAPGQFLAVGDGRLAVTGNAEAFRFVPAGGCANFPEAESNFSGRPFSGTRPDGSVVGHVDAHVHISATEFLGGLQHGYPYHRFGVEHALSDCSERHGPNGYRDIVGGLFATDTDGHDTAGFPHFNEWPARDMLTHEAIYWKWLERSWAAGLRVIVNDLVDNETLCELQRQISGNPNIDCNSMNNAGRQAGTMYGMMDYIDAQYGGRGAGFFRIVHNAAQAREVIADGKIAVILGIEISNLFNCKVNYAQNPERKGPHEEPMYFTPGENSYTCTPESLVEQMERAWGWGVRQLITIHEFDNAFGGNGIFDGLILNLGNRENSGMIPSGDLARATNLLAAGGDASQVAALFDNPGAAETPTGEWWTTYDCPIEGETEGFSGYLWGSSGGSTQSYLSPPYCHPLGQDGRWGGPTPCYPSGEIPNEYEGYRFSDYPPFDQYPQSKNNRQCNARWMTPIGLFAYQAIMARGFIFDWDHAEMGMKTQILELTESQEPPYPIVSTHGTFGGTTIDQATRLLRAGGVLYPSNGSSRGFREDMAETLSIHEKAVAGAKKNRQPLFGFGYGTDTNGLSGQTGPRGGDIAPGKEITYPYTFYQGDAWGDLVRKRSAQADPADASPRLRIEPVVFDQPVSRDADGNIAREWHQDVDGNAHHGMLSGFVQEIVLEGGEAPVRHLFNAAEVYLRMWEQTERSSANFDPARVPAGILREAPGGSSTAPTPK